MTSSTLLFAAPSKAGSQYGEKGAPAASTIACFICILVVLEHHHGPAFPPQVSPYSTVSSTSASMSASSASHTDSTPAKRDQSYSQRFVAGAGDFGETSKLPWPVRIVAEFFQYLIAILLVAFGKAIQAAFQKRGSGGHTARGKRNT